MKDSFLICVPPLCATATAHSRLSVRAMAGTKAIEDVHQMPFANLWVGTELLVACVRCLRESLGGACT